MASRRNMSSSSLATPKETIMVVPTFALVADDGKKNMNNNNSNVNMMNSSLNNSIAHHSGLSSGGPPISSLTTGPDSIGDNILLLGSNSPPWSLPLSWLEPPDPFTAEHECDEQKSFSKHEKRSIAEDLYGQTVPSMTTLTSSTTLSVMVSRRNTVGTPSNTPVVTGKKSSIPSGDQRAVDPKVCQQRLHQVISEQIFDMEKRHYYDALEACPEEIFHTESSALRFLRCTGFDQELAAQKLVRYWEMRRLLFQERAYLPMTLDGALGGSSSDEAKILRKASSSPPFAVLPKDKHGRIILYDQHDCTDVPSFGRFCMVRIAWYVIHKALLDEEQQNQQPTNRVVWLWNLHVFSTVMQFDRTQTMLLTKSIHEALPIKTCAMHCVFGSVPGSMVLRLSMPFMNRDARARIVRHDQRVYHQQTDKRDNEEDYTVLLDKLENFGVSRFQVPRALGGMYRFTGAAATAAAGILEQKEKQNYMN